MEIYALEERPLSKFLATAAKSEIEATTLTSMLKPAWATLYALRYVLHRHGDGARIVNRFANKCVDNAGSVVADAKELLQLSQPTPQREALSSLLDLHQKYLAMIPEKTLDGIRGHDAAPLIARFLKLKNDLANEDQVERLLRQSIELCDLDKHALFTALRERVSPN